MRYDERVIDQVQTANDIVDVIGQYVPLKRSGRSFKGICPFHAEKTPSFMVHPERQIFHCFGCSAGGNVFGFLMRYENLSFPEALRQLAERAHIVLPEKNRDSEGPSDTEKFYEIYRLACEFYRKQFLDPQKGAAARDYFLKRGFTLESAEEHKMGCATDAWQGLLNFLLQKGFKEDILLKSGLLFRSQAKGNLFDAFRNRLLFPIHNLQGKVVAFGGRILDDKGTPKYLNSPENPVFIKRKELFGLHLAKKFIDREKPRILVVEGYFGFLRLYQSGFKNTVATLGTALSEDHVQVLKRFAEEAIVIYDGDKAGEAASLRGLEVFLEGGMNVKIARLTGGLDPDDFIKEKGPEAFQKLLDEARDFFDYKLETLLGRYNRTDSLGLMKMTTEFLDTFVKIKNPVLLDRYLRRLAASLGVDENSLRSELMKLKKKTGESFRARNSKPVSRQSSIEADDEILLLWLAIEDKQYRGMLFEEFTGEDFVDGEYRDLFNALHRMDEENQQVTWPAVLNRLKGERFKERLVAASSLEWGADEKQKAFTDCIKKNRQKKVERRLDDLRRSIARAEQEGNLSQVGAFVKEYQALWKQTGK